MENIELNSNSERFVTIGRVRRVVGLNGRLEVEFYSDDGATGPDGYGEGDEILIEGRKFVIERVTGGRKGSKAIHLKGVTDRTSAEALRGLDIEVPESSLPPLEEGQYYHYQLLDCTVVDLEGQRIGTLSGIMETGSNDVYVVTTVSESGTGEEREILIPATKDTIIEVDIVDKIVKVDLPVDQRSPGSLENLAEPE